MRVKCTKHIYIQLSMDLVESMSGYADLFKYGFYLYDDRRELRYGRPMLLDKNMSIVPFFVMIGRNSDEANALIKSLTAHERRMIREKVKIGAVKKMFM